MDDRFDFILISNNLKFGVKQLTYVPGSYHAVGQDGLHFNKDITASPTNTSVPPDVLAALYGNSDHLPVTLKLAVDKTLGVYDWLAGEFLDIRFNNPVTSQIRLTITTAKPTRLYVDLFNLCGKAVFKYNVNLISGQNKLDLNVEGIPAGMYLMKMSGENKQTVTRKLVIN
jgi:hypothetical protein